MNVLRLADLVHTRGMAHRDWSFVYDALRGREHVCNPMVVEYHADLLINYLRACIRHGEAALAAAEDGELTCSIFDEARLARDFGLRVRDDSFDWCARGDEGMLCVFVALWLSGVFERAGVGGGGRAEEKKKRTTQK